MTMKCVAKTWIKRHLLG